MKRILLLLCLDNDVVIYVPKGTREAYKNESSLFENVVEVDFDN